MRRRAADVAACALLLAVAAWYTWSAFWWRPNGPLPGTNLDYYGYFYPNWLYAMQAIERGWGLLWNPFQNCGQPFLAISTTGLFYPLHLLFVLFGPDLGQYVEVALHLAVGGIGLYWLARELGVGVAGALAGAAAFALGGTTIQLASWLPTVIAPYAWMPAALAAAERVLRAPRLGNALVLAVVLAIQILPGYPQITFFTYLAIGLRAAVVLIAPGATRRLPLIGALAVGLGLPLGLAAIQFLPALEFAGESLRSGRLSREEVFPVRQTMDWTKFLLALAQRTGFGAAVMLLPAALAGAALAASRRRAVVWSYTALLALSLALSFDTPVFELFYRLPVGGSFRLPYRFLWLAACVLCVLAALGVDAAAHGREGRRRPAVLVGAAVGAAAFAALSPMRLYPPELPLLGALLGCLAMAVFVPRIGRWTIGLVPVLVAVNAVWMAAPPAIGPARDGHVLFARRAAFDWLRERMTLQDRVYPLTEVFNFGLGYKTPSLFEVRSITDYETQASMRIAKVYVRTFLNRPMRGINDYYFKLIRHPQNRPLFDLMATRYLMVDAADKRAQITLEPPLREVAHIGQTRIFENAGALPRAFWAPRALVIADPNRAVEWLAAADNDPRRTVLLETPPADGFLGAQGDAQADPVTITADRGEMLSLKVSAPAEGFLALTDQYYPGWSAMVNGAPTPVLRANVAFRAVRVPAGESTVEFHYRPLSVRLGAIVSAVCWAFVLGYALYRLRSRFRIQDPGSRRDSLDLRPVS